jgi:hypothetical protein
VHQHSQNRDTLAISTLFVFLIFHMLTQTSRPEDFMRKYMWPNSCLPSATALITAANTGSEGRFTLEGVENHAARKYLFSSHVILNH